MVSKFLNLIALSALALLACSYGNSPVNALSLDSGHLHARHNHGLLAKRAPNRRCKSRSSTSTPAPKVTPPPPANNPPPPPQTTSSTPPAPPPPPPSNPPASSSGVKAGLAWAAGDNPAILRNFGARFIYNWSPFKVNGADQAGFESVPMLWGTKFVEDWKRLVVPGYARFALGFNEPDHRDQAYMDPGAAAGLWNQHMRHLRNSGYTLISPATTSAPNSKEWMRSFLNACGGGCVDKIAVHWYGTVPEQFIAYLRDWHDTFGLPIWVTEFACMDFTYASQCDYNQALNFARTVKGFMDSTPWVERYFPFGMQHNMGNVNPVNQLLAGDRPTELGRIYFN